MADETETYLINFKDNLDVYTQRAADAAKEVERLKKANDDLKKSEDATQEQREQVNGQLKVAQQEYRNAQKAVESATKANKAQKGSYDELYNRWQLAQVQLKKLGDGYTLNSKGVRVLSEEYKKQSKVVADAKDALNKFTTGVHDGRNTVGLYGEAFDKAFSQMPGVMGQAAGSVHRLGDAFKALLLNPVILLVTILVAAVVGLVKVLKSTDEGANFFEAKMNQIKAAMDVVRLKTLDLIDNLKSGITTIKDNAAAWIEHHKTLTKIVGVLAALLNPLTAVYALMVKMGIVKAKEVFGDVADAATEYTYALDALNDAETNYVSQKSKNENEIARLEAKSKDRTISTEERRKALQDAIALGEEEANKQKEFADKRLDIETKFLASKYGLTQDSINQLIAADDDQAKALMANNEGLAKFRDRLGDESYQKLEELYAKSLDADTKYYDENKKNLAKLSQFELEILQQRQKNEMGFLEARAIQDKNNAEKLLNDKLAIAELQKKQELQAIDITEGEKAAIIAKYNDQELQLRIDYQAQLAKIAQDQLNREIQLYQIENRNKAGLLQGQFDLQKQALEEKLASDLELNKANQQKILELQGQFTVDLANLKAKKDDAIKAQRLKALQTDYDNELALAQNNIFAQLDIEAQGLKMKQQQEIDAAKENGADIGLINDKYVKAELIIERKKRDAKLQLASDFAGNLALIFGKNTAIGKAAAVAQTMISTFAAAQKAYESVIGIPVVGPVLAVAAAGAAVAAGLANVKAILAVKSGLPGDSGGASSLSGAANHVTAQPIGASVLNSPNNANAVTNNNVNAGLTSDAIAEAMSKIPAPIVTVEDINARTRSKIRVEEKANI